MSLYPPGTIVIIDNPNMIIDSADPYIRNQGERIIGRIGIVVCEGIKDRGYIILIGKQNHWLFEGEFTKI